MYSLSSCHQFIARVLLVAMVLAGAAPGRAAAIEPAAPSEKEMIAAAEKGNPQAMFDLARAYADNRFQLDPYPAEKAVAWYRRAAEKGHPAAMMWYGWSLEEGWGTPRDLKTAVEWTTKAAKAGDPNAMFALGAHYAYGDATEAGLPKDEEIGVEWFKKAAAAGNLDAFIHIARAYHEGYGVPKKPERAVEWLLKAAAIMDTSSSGDELSRWEIMEVLARDYFSGDGVAKDPAEGLRWLKRGVETGQPSFSMELGRRYLQGDGVKQDLAKARQLLTQGEVREKDTLWTELLATEKKIAAGAAAPAPPKNVGVTPLTWADRTLRAPKGYEMLEASDVWCGIDPDLVDSTPNFLVWRMAPGNTLSEVNDNRFAIYGTSELDLKYNKVIIHGSDVLGKISLGWVAYVILADKGWVQPGEQRLMGVGFVYGAVSKEEALKEAFKAAQTKLREQTTAPIAYVGGEYGVSAKPNWALYQQEHTICRYGTCLAWGRIIRPDAKTMKGESGIAIPQQAGDIPGYIEALEQKSWAEAMAMSGADYIRNQNKEMYPYWDQHSPLSRLSFNTPKPMMPEPVFEIVEEAAAKP